MNTNKIITPSEKELLLSAARISYYRDFVMISLCLHTGLRNSELINLIINDVSDNGDISTYLTVRSENSKAGSFRTIPLSKSTVTLLREFIEWKQKNNEPTDSFSLLFLTHYNKKTLSPRDFQRFLRKLSLQSIGRPINPHVLRHTFATDLTACTNLRVIQILLGHKCLNSTQRYTHPNSEQLQTAVDNL
ncbi:MAG TPA: hypothetical protein ENH82_10875 [bacterium]|nr:hypothetical protein [bacterium]